MESAGDRCRSSAEDVQTVEEDRRAALDDGRFCEGRELYASGEARQGHVEGGFDRPERGDVANGAEVFSLQVVGFEEVVGGAEALCDEWRDSGKLRVHRCQMQECLCIFLRSSCCLADAVDEESNALGG